MLYDADSQPVDLRRMQELSDGDREFEHEVLEAYLQDCEERLARLATAVPQGDLSSVRRDAHTIKGASGNVGTTRLQDIARDLEHLYEHWDGERAAQLLAALRAEFSKVKAFLGYYLEHGAAPASGEA